MNRFFEKLTTRSLVLFSLSLFFVSIMLVTWIAEENNRQVMIERENDFIREITEISVKQIYAILLDDAVEFGRHTTQSEAFNSLFSESSTAPAARLAPYLQSLLKSDYKNSDTMTLVKLRLYDSNLNLIAGTDDHVKESVFIESVSAQKANKNPKIYSGRWSDKLGTYFSVLIPFYEAERKGYLEVVSNAALNLPVTEIYIGYHVDVIDQVNQLQNYTGNKHNLKKSADEENFHQVTTTIYTLDNKAAYQIVVHVPFTKFLQQIDANQKQSLISSASISLLILGFILLVLELLLIRPIERLRRDIHLQAASLTGEPVSTRGIKEFHDLSASFNHLIQIAKANTDALHQKTLLDELTQLPNRRALEQFFEKIEKDAIRSKRPVSILMLDVDYFKKYNDTYGHQAGDECLKDVASAIKKVMKRATDLAGRYGGEEFTVVMPYTGLDGANTMAEHILQSVREADIPHKASEVSHRVTVSIGIAVSDNIGEGGIKKLIEAADENLYQAKKSGRNRSYTG